MATPATPAAAFSVVPELGSSYGVMLISTIITAALYGVTVLQALYYYEQFPKDSWILKITVAVICALDTSTIVFDTHALYYYLISNFANPPALQTEIWSTQAELLVTYTVVVMVQFFFIHRMHQLRPHMWYIPAILALAAIASYATVLVILVQVLRNPDWEGTNALAVIQPLEANWALGMFVDVTITAVLCWYMWSEKYAVRKKTNILLNRIIVFSVNRGAIAAFVQIMSLAAKLIWPQTLVWLAFHNILSKVYANSMLATLNARVSFRKVLMDTELDMTKPPTTFSAAGPTSRPVSKVPRIPIREGHQPVSTLRFAARSALTSEDTRSSFAGDNADYQGPYIGYSAGTPNAHSRTSQEDELEKGSFMHI